MTDSDTSYLGKSRFWFFPKLSRFKKEKEAQAYGASKKEELKIR